MVFEALSYFQFFVARVGVGYCFEEVKTSLGVPDLANDCFDFGSGVGEAGNAKKVVRSDGVKSGDTKGREHRGPYYAF